MHLRLARHCVGFLQQVAAFIEMSDGAVRGRLAIGALGGLFFYARLRAVKELGTTDGVFLIVGGDFCFVTFNVILINFMRRKNAAGTGSPVLLDFAVVPIVGFLDNVLTGISGFAGIVAQGLALQKR